MDYFKCGYCNYKCKRIDNLKSHELYKHDINVIWNYCDLCKYKGKSKSDLKQHQINIHDINVKWRYCNICEFKAKNNSKLKEHRANVHDIDVKWYLCNICEYRAKQKSKLKQHQANIHDIDVKWHECTLCKFKTKTIGSLKSHKANIHDIDIQWNYCKLCNYRTKQKDDIKRHSMYKHNVDVKWFCCKICKDKLKSKKNLKQHLENIHGIGKYHCDFCLSNRNSTNLYKDHIKINKICNKCYKKTTNKNTRIEHIWSNYIDEKIGTEYLSSSDKSLKSNGGCQLYRPDKLYIGVDLVEINECDEKQHLTSNYTTSCEDKRISEIYEEDGICGKQMIIVRWNPHSYKVKKNMKKKNRKEKLDLMIELKKYIKVNPPKQKIFIYYMFYDEDNPLITKNYPYKLIYDKLF